jgi:ABC-type multidrug transport system permease subunit
MNMINEIKTWWKGMLIICIVCVLVTAFSGILLFIAQQFGNMVAISVMAIAACSPWAYLLGDMC